ncbi:MAG: tetratricopeptide repeat protein [Bacteroidia bacterium]
METIDSALELQPKADEQFQALSYKASVLLSLHQFEKALGVAEKAVQINPHNAQIYGALVDAPVELGNSAEAVKMADKMVSIRPDLRSYSRVSYLREIYGEKQGAIEAMEMAVKAGLPGTEEAAWARLNLGGLYYKNGDTAMAEAQYQRILAERPNYPFAIAAQAQIAADKGEFEQAEILLNTAIELIPEVGFYQQLAAIYQNTGREKEKEKTVSEMLLMLKDDEAQGHNMGLAYAELHLELSHNYAEALKYANEEYAARPQNSEVNTMLAKVYAKMGRAEEAEKHLKKATIGMNVSG